MQVKKNQYEIWEPVGVFWGPEIDSMDWLRDARTLVKAVQAKLYVRPIDYIIRENGKSYTCNPEVCPTKQSLIFKRRQKKLKTKHELCTNFSYKLERKKPANSLLLSLILKSYLFELKKFRHLDYVIQSYKEYHTCCGNGLLSHFLC